MNKVTYLTKFLPSLLLVSGSFAMAEKDEKGPIEVTQFAGAGPGREQPILVSLSGFTGEAAQVLR
jgi:hypothetical protein